jgi:hypothetical protein
VLRQATGETGSEKMALQESFPTRDRPLYILASHHV